MRRSSPVNAGSVTVPASRSTPVPSVTGRSMRATPSSPRRISPLLTRASKGRPAARKAIGDATRTVPVTTGGGPAATPAPTLIGAVVFAAMSKSRSPLRWLSQGKTSGATAPSVSRPRTPACARPLSLSPQSSTEPAVPAKRAGSTRIGPPARAEHPHVADRVELDGVHGAAARPRGARPAPRRSR